MKPTIRLAAIVGASRPTSAGGQRHVPGGRRDGGVPLQAVRDAADVHGARRRHARPHAAAGAVARAPRVPHRHEQVAHPTLLRARREAALPALLAARRAHPRHRPILPRRRIRRRRYPAAAKKKNAPTIYYATRTHAQIIQVFREHRNRKTWSAHGHPGEVQGHGLHRRVLVQDRHILQDWRPIQL